MAAKKSGSKKSSSKKTPDMVTVTLDKQTLEALSASIAMLSQFASAILTAHDDPSAKGGAKKSAKKSAKKKS